MAALRTFKDWWFSLSETTKERINLHDAEFVWMSRTSDMVPYKLAGRREALKELIYELDSHDYFQARDLVKAFYKTDKSYIGEENEKA